jgi:hypothetical protein
MYAITYTYIHIPLIMIQTGRNVWKNNAFIVLYNILKYLDGSHSRIMYSTKCRMTLGLTQPLTEMNTRNISLGVKAAGA